MRNKEVTVGISKDAIMETLQEQGMQADMRTATEITNYFKGVFPEYPALGDFALFGAGVNATPYK